MQDDLDAVREYEDLIAATRIVLAAQDSVRREEQLGFHASPAQRLLGNVQRYILDQASVVLRGHCGLEP